MPVQAPLIKVIIANNYRLLREGIKNGLSTKEDVSVIDQAENGLELLEMLEKLHPDIIIMDIRMPVMDAPEALPIINKKYPAIKVIIHAIHNDPVIIRKMMEIGANAYLTLESGTEEIYEAIKVCYLKEFFINDIVRYAFTGTMPGYTGRYSDTEISLLAKLSDGDSTNKIADEIDLSPRTVLAIIDKLKAKTGTRSIEAIIEFVIKNKII